MPDIGAGIQSATLRRTMALAYLARNGRVINNGARRDFTVTGPIPYQFDGCRTRPRGEKPAAWSARGPASARPMVAHGWDVRAASNPQSPRRRRVKGMFGPRFAAEGRRSPPQKVSR